MNTTTVQTDTAAGPDEELALKLAAEMRRRWRDGERPAAEQFLSDHPELWQIPEAAVELIYEEYCLRQVAGDQKVEQDILYRFPQWSTQLRLMLDCHRVLQSDESQLPVIGDRIGDFTLVAEVARGSRGRVFIAHEAALADRPVILKITPLSGGEHLSLARLQHTNIVPLYSVVDDQHRRIRMLCMPYFGRATLASLLQFLSSISLAERTGRHIVAAIERMQESATSPSAIPGAARQMLENVSYDQAMCWIIASLADALQFAHERGVVHLDLKPSNVLLASDGQPMLLDFHLARAPIHPGGALPENFGGTPPYMPPEQQSAMQSFQNGDAVAVTVDGRADIFALGAMLYESLGGEVPIRDDSPPLEVVNPQVSIGLSDIVARCIASRPEDRYADVSALGEDLRRHITHQPLLGVFNRSIAERWSKWRQRQPNRLRAVGLLVVATVAIAILLLGIWSHMHDRHEQAELALYDGQRQLQADQNSEAVQTFERGLNLVKSMPFEQHLRQQLRDQLAAARRRNLAQQLHGLADEIRVLYGNDSIPADRLRSLASASAAFWQKRYAMVDQLARAQDSQLNTDLQDIAIFAASLQSKLSPHSKSRDALRILDEAEAMFGRSAVLDHERGSHQLDASSSQPSLSMAPRSAWEHYALGRSFLDAGDLPHAAAELGAARKLDPAGRWPNFHYGVCAYRMGLYEDAVEAFSVRIGTSPKVAGCFYNRALANAALDRPEQALVDYDHALRLDPSHSAAALNRGMLHFEMGHRAQAIADLTAALSHGADPATVHYDLALIHLAAGDRTRALHQADLALQHSPTQPQAIRLRDSLVDQGQNRP